MQTMVLPAKCPPLNTLALEKADWGLLRETYGARPGGTWSYPLFTQGADPGFRLAAQIDLDRVRGGEPYVLDWARLLGEQTTAKETPAAPKLSLMELAAQITGAAPVAVVERPVFTDGDLRQLRDALGVAICEIGAPQDQELHGRIDAYLKSVS